MTMPAGWKNPSGPSVKMTLDQFRINIKQYPRSVEFNLAEAAVIYHSLGLQLVGGNVPPYTPTTWNVLTGERRIGQDVEREKKVMTDARTADYHLDDEMKGIQDSAKEIANRGVFALAYVLFWKLYHMEIPKGVEISDLPQFMEQCLNLFRPTGPKDILNAATFYIQDMPEDPVYRGNPIYTPLFRKVLSEYSKAMNL